MDLEHATGQARVVISWRKYPIKHCDWPALNNSETASGKAEFDKDQQPHKLT
ncbi:hypothetical protein PITC_013030 [Penicillium italicum]|uniref:Uncharacterized protein n=1 Tax=Penicillium italicum TaxID=40296 RepID=A0A0A2KHU4_PENIT|nr:hypothetical protein PITC_013030 [Penicillium italicum]